MASLLNANVAYNTWKSYQGTLARLHKLEKKHSLDLSLPWSSSSKALNYVLALDADGLKPSSIENYLSAIKMAHKAFGFPIVIDRDILNPVLKGMDNLQEANPPRRLAVTPAILKLIRNQLKKQKWTILYKRMIWCACLFLFWSCCRSAELFAPSCSKMVASTTFRANQVGCHAGLIDGLNVNWMELTLKNTKEMKNSSKKATSVELFPTGNFLCPIDAFRKFKRIVTDWDESLPLFRIGKVFLTQKQFNCDLRLLLSEHFDYAAKSVSSHSFRAGISTAMARCGFSDEEIKLQGRWSSDAFSRYIRQARSIRLSAQKKISEAMAAISCDEPYRPIIVA